MQVDTVKGTKSKGAIGVLRDEDGERKRGDERRKERYIELERGQCVPALRAFSLIIGAFVATTSQ